MPRLRTVTSFVASKLGPEVFRFDITKEAQSVGGDDSSYKLRPETVESWFILYRLTHKSQYRDWSWNFVQVGGMCSHDFLSVFSHP